MAKTKKQPEPETSRYKLIAGLHQDKDGLHDAKDGRTNVIVSRTDLAKRFPEKFRKLSDTDDLPQAPKSGVVDTSSLESMSNEQLSQLAKDNEVDLKGAETREDAIELLRNALETGPVDTDDNE